MDDGADALRRKRVVRQSQPCPAQQRACGQDDSESVGAAVRPHELLADVIGVADHTGDKLLGQLRETLPEQRYFGIGFGIAHFDQHKSVHESQIQSQHALVQTGVITPAIAVCRSDEATHGVGLDEFAVVFGDT